MVGENPLEKLRKVGILKPELGKALIEKYDYRGEKALRLVREGRVLEFRGKTYVWGDHGIYQVEKGKCSCPAGYRLVKKGIVPRYPESGGKPYIPSLKRKKCSHSIALQIAQAIGRIVKVPEDAIIDDYLTEGKRSE